MENNKKSYLLPIAMMFGLFFMISFVTGLQNPMGVIIKSQFAASNFVSQLGNLANFIAYAFMGIPAGLLLSKIGYKKTALAAIAGMLLCSAYPSLTPYTGSMPGIKAFVAAVFGGIGSIPGALIGGIILGIIEILSKAYISSQMADAIVFMVLIIVLLVKPTGILGKKIQEKV